jgi:hypothetical protein
MIIFPIAISPFPLQVYYSRKNFFRPQLQPQLHATFDEEINHLDGFFQGKWIREKMREGSR